jgi:DnaJ-class molecular chaperone
VSGCNPRIVDCPACEGEGAFEHVTGYDPRDGSPTGWIDQCRYCGGEGSVIEDAELIDEDDLEAIAGEVAEP